MRHLNQHCDIELFCVGLDENWRKYKYNNEVVYAYPCLVGLKSIRTFVVMHRCNEVSNQRYNRL